MGRHQNKQQALTPEQAEKVLENCKSGLVDESISMKQRQQLLRACESTIKKNEAFFSPDQRHDYMGAVSEARALLKGEQKEIKREKALLNNSASYNGQEVTQLDLMEGKKSLTVGFKGSLARDAKGMLAEAGIIPNEWMDRKLSPNVYDVGTRDKVKEFQSTPEFKAANPTTPANGQFDKATMDAVLAKLKAGGQ